MPEGTARNLNTFPACGFLHSSIGHMWKLLGRISVQQSNNGMKGLCDFGFSFVWGLWSSKFRHCSGYIPWFEIGSSCRGGYSRTHKPFLWWKPILRNVRLLQLFSSSLQTSWEFRLNTLESKTYLITKRWAFSDTLAATAMVRLPAVFVFVLKSKSKESGIVWKMINKLWNLRE